MYTCFAKLYTCKQGNELNSSLTNRSSIGYILIKTTWTIHSYICVCVVRLSRKLFGQGYVREGLKSSPRKFYGRYGDIIKQNEVPLSQLLHAILGHDHIQWHPQLIRHFTKSWRCYRTRPYYRFWCHYLIPGVFHRTFATVAASQQRTLSPPDTWSCPIWDLHLFL